MRIGKPLCGRSPHAGNNRRKCTERAAADYQPPVAKGVLNALHDSTELSNLLFGNARSQYRQLNGLGNGIKSDGDGYKTNSVPKKELAKSIALDPGNRIQSNGSQHQSYASSDDALKGVFAA